MATSPFMASSFFKQGANGHTSHLPSTDVRIWRWQESHAVWRAVRSEVCRPRMTWSHVKQGRHVWMPGGAGAHKIYRGPNSPPVNLLWYVVLQNVPVVQSLWDSHSECAGGGRRRKGGKKSPFTETKYAHQVIVAAIVRLHPIMKRQTAQAPSIRSYRDIA